MRKIDEEEPLILDVKNLKTYFKVSENTLVKAVDGVNFRLKKGHIMGIIGESGSGKSVTSRAILQIVEKPGFIPEGEVIFEGKDLLKLSKKEMAEYRGKKISMIFQNPTTSFNPYMTMGEHLIEAYKTYNKRSSRAEAKKRALEVLKMVGIHDGEAIMNKYPCDFSAGFRQRVFIAMSMILNPTLLIADEPTTSLGITLQAEIMSALSDVQKETGISIIIITHDFGVVSQFSDDIFVMYAGKCVEYSPKKELLIKARHPYTIGLIRSVPLLEARKEKRLKNIPGLPPNMAEEHKGCTFAPRCEYAQAKCFEEAPELKLVGKDHYCACHFMIDYDTSSETELEG